MTLDERLSLATRLRIEAHQAEQKRYALALRRAREQRADRNTRAFIFASACLALASFLGLLIMWGGR